MALIEKELIDDSAPGGMSGPWPDAAEPSTMVDVEPEQKSPGKLRWAERLDIPARPEYVACVRRHLVDLITYAGFSSIEALDVAVAVSEALSNAIEHARSSGSEPEVNVECQLDPAGLQVIIRDKGGSSWDPDAVEPEGDPDDDLAEVSHRGRGLDFMRALTDELSINVTDEGTEVRIFKRPAVNRA